MLFRGGLFCSLIGTVRPLSADATFYLSAKGLGEGAAPTAPFESQLFSTGGGSFHIWVQPDELFTGISLNLDASGSGIRFTESVVHNPVIGGDERWLSTLIRHGSVTDKRITRIEAGALEPLSGSGVGIGNSVPSSDPFYEPAAGFLFATVDYAVDQPSESSTISLSIGHNLLSDAEGIADEAIFLGAGDGPVTVAVGSMGSEIDLSLMPLVLAASDFDEDGSVDGTDFLLWQRGYGITSGATRSQGDADADGDVDDADLALWQSQYGTIPISVAASVVPEPSSLALTLMLTLGRLFQRRLR